MSTFYKNPINRFLMGQPRPLFSFIFGLFKQTIQFLQQINMQKCRSSKRRQDSNPQPLAHKSSPITTRPGLPSYPINLIELINVLTWTIPGPLFFFRVFCTVTFLPIADDWIRTADHWCWKWPIRPPCLSPSPTYTTQRFLKMSF